MMQLDSSVADSASVEMVASDVATVFKWECPVIRYLFIEVSFQLCSLKAARVGECLQMAPFVGVVISTCMCHVGFSYCPASSRDETLVQVHFNLAANTRDHRLDGVLSFLVTDVQLEPIKD